MRLPLLLILSAACTGTPPVQPTPPAPSKPDVVIITLDTTRADRLGCYGDPLARTRNLDNLAQDSVLFRQAATPIPLTLPAHTSLFSGQYPSHHGIRDNGGYRVGPDVPLLAEQLRSQGYDTGAFVGAYVLDSSWGLDRGFIKYYDDFHPMDIAEAQQFGAVSRSGRDVVRQALAWWESPERGDAPKLMWVHLFDAHTPYEPGVDWKGDPYRGEIFELDRALRPLLLSIPDDALIIVAADHGENLWDGQELEHGVVLTRSTVRIPLIIRPPGGVAGNESPPAYTPPARPSSWKEPDGLHIPGLVLDPVPDAPTAGRVIDTPVSLVDIAPTVIELTGGTCTHCDGRSLVPALRGDTLPDVPVYAETAAPYYHYGWAPQFVAMREHTVLLRDLTDQTFDMRTDPWWQAPLHPSPDASLVEAVDTYSAGWTEPGGALDPATAAALQALHYATSRVTTQGAPTESARDHIGLMHRMFRAQGRMVSQPKAALAELEELVVEAPDLVDAWFTIGTMRWGNQDFDGAIAALDQVIERSPDHPLAHNNKLYILRETGQDDRALQYATELAQSNPQDGRWHRHRVDMLGRKEQPKLVQEACERGLEQIPNDPFLEYMLGLARLQNGDPQGGLKALTASKKHGTRANDVDLWIGQANERIGDIDAAVVAYRDQANRTPADLRPAVAAAKLLAKHDRCTDALPYLLTAIQRGVKDPSVHELYKVCGGL